METLLASVRKCQICKDLPLGPLPILQAKTSARILIAGQAPGQRTHHKGIPFDDPSGVRLRHWLGIDETVFYDADRIAIVPMGFCYPGTGKGGDLPPRAECIPAWRQQILGKLEKIELTLIIGHYAIDWHLGEKKSKTLTQTVANWQSHWPEILPLPHPSPRNMRWFKKNQWFETEVLPVLKSRVASILGECRD